MKTRAEHLSFIRLNAGRLAAHAWQGYEASGRGLLCVLCEDHNEALGTVPYDFAAVAVASKFIQPWEGSKEQRLAAEYDPRTEMLVCFLGQQPSEGMSVDTYRTRPTPPPPEAAERE